MVNFTEFCKLYRVNGRTNRSLNVIEIQVLSFIQSEGSTNEFVNARQSGYTLKWLQATGRLNGAQSMKADKMSAYQFAKAVFSMVRDEIGTISGCEKVWKSLL